MSRTVGQDEILSVLVSLSHPLNEDGSLEAMTSRRCSNSEEFCLISKTSLLRDSFSAVSFRVETTASLPGHFSLRPRGLGTRLLRSVRSGSSFTLSSVVPLLTSLLSSGSSVPGFITEV